MTVVVAGGTRGIGLELARGLTDGSVVLGYSADEESAARAQQLLRDEGSQVVLVRADLSRPEGAAQLVAAVPAGETISCLVHSAVRVAPGPLTADPSVAAGAEGEAESAVAEEDWGDALAVNATSLLWLTRAARPLLRRGSSVLYLSSRGGRIVVPGYGSIGPAKALGEALVRYLAVELAPAGVRVNALAPGTQDTAALRQVFGNRTDEVVASTRAKNPSGRLVEPADYVAVARFLTSPEAAMVTGQVQFVHGGTDLLG